LEAARKDRDAILRQRDEAIELAAKYQQECRPCPVQCPVQHQERTLHVNERLRTYWLHNGSRVCFSNVTTVHIRKSGNHHVVCRNGMSGIVTPVWSHIVVEGSAGPWQT
jgi:uncharacterized Fe-S radical SAM superfamily protein PflX